MERAPCMFMRKRVQTMCSPAIAAGAMPLIAQQPGRGH